MIQQSWQASSVEVSTIVKNDKGKKKNWGERQVLKVNKHWEA